MSQILYAETRLQLFLTSFLEIISTWQNFACSGINSWTDKIRTSILAPQTCLYILLYEEYLKWKELSTFGYYYYYLRVNWHMRLSGIYLTYVDNTLISNTVLIHFKPTFSISTPLENIRTSGVFRGIEMEHWLKLG